jgi:DNA-binding response OmpR family regulator
MTGFSDGAEALAFIKEPTSPVPDLLILDINVPGVEGPSILNAVRGNTRWSHIAVFVFTSSRAPADVARVKALGADRYLVKPMDLDGFLQFGQNISAWLEKREAPFGKEQEILD